MGLKIAFDNVTRKRQTMKSLPDFRNSKSSTPKTCSIIMGPYATVCEVSPVRPAGIESVPNDVERHGGGGGGERCLGGGECLRLFG